MKPTIDMVREFHRRFGHPVNPAPTLDDDQLNALRLELLREELSELAEAIAARDTVEVLDALCDLQYVLDGAFLALGFGFIKHTAFEEVQRSNMSKLGEDGQPVVREDGKILKGPNWSPPDLRSIIVSNFGEC